MQGRSTWTNILGSAVIIKCFQRVALRVASFTGEADELPCLLEKISKSSSSTALGCHGTSSTSHTFNNSLPWLLSNFCFNGKSLPFLPSTAAAPDDVSLFRRLPTNRSHSSGLCVTADGFTLEKSLTAILWSSVDSFHNEICFSVELYKYKG